MGKFAFPDLIFADFSLVVFVVLTIKSILDLSLNHLFYCSRLDIFLKTLTVNILRNLA